ncbi:MAG TPA: TIGR03067 domain-containing protein [Gemmataceae bacterium]|nr:TIGR03067 domain-containing protein [Gemmataceae bacterium]
MNPTTKLLGMSLAVGLVLAARPATGGDPKGDDAKSDLAGLTGTWVRVLDGKTYIVTFNGEKFATIFEFPEGITTTSGTITIDPTKSPKHMDWKFAEGTGRGEKLKGKTAQTIYALDGDTFKFLATRQEGRPEMFPDKEGVGDYIYLVFKRVK